MNRLWLIGLITAAVALLPWSYLQLVWSDLPAQVPIHFSGGQADRFTSREVLHDLTWLPVIIFLALTLLPQVHTGQSLFWRSDRQRQLRGALVGFSSFVIGALVYKAAQL